MDFQPLCSWFHNRLDANTSAEVSPSSSSEANIRMACRLRLLGLLFAVPAFLVHRSKIHFNLQNSEGSPVRGKYELWNNAHTLHGAVGQKVPLTASLLDNPLAYNIRNVENGKSEKNLKQHGKALEDLVVISGTTSDKPPRKFLSSAPPLKSTLEKQDDGTSAAQLGREERAPSSDGPMEQFNAAKPVEAEDENSTHFSQEKNVGRVAICIVGHARTFHLKAVHQSILDNFVTPIKNSSSNADVFFHIGMRDISRPQYGPPANKSDSATEAAMQLFHPVHISRYTNLGPNIDKKNRRPCPSGTSHASNIYHSALTRSHECTKFILAHEKEHGLTYTWIAKTRPDVAFGDPVSSLQTLTTDRAYINEHDPRGSEAAFPTLREKFPERAARVLRAPLADHVALVPRALADVFFEAYEGSHTCLTDRQKGRLMNAETVLGLWLVGHGVRYEVLPMFWMIVRPQGGPECERVGRSIGVGTDRGKVLRRRCEEFSRSGQIGGVGEGDAKKGTTARVQRGKLSRIKIF